jgi:hypothetical protein
MGFNLGLDFGLVRIRYYVPVSWRFGPHGY